jgi:hypothetical protein
MFETVVLSEMLVTVVFLKAGIPCATWSLHVKEFHVPYPEEQIHTHDPSEKQGQSL